MVRSTPWPSGPVNRRSPRGRRATAHSRRPVRAAHPRFRIRRRVRRARPARPGSVSEPERPAHRSQARRAGHGRCTARRTARSGSTPPPAQAPLRGLVPRGLVRAPPVRAHALVREPRRCRARSHQAPAGHGHQAPVRARPPAPLPAHDSLSRCPGKAHRALAWARLTEPVSGHDSPRPCPGTTHRAPASACVVVCAGPPSVASAAVYRSAGRTPFSAVTRCPSGRTRSTVCGAAPG